MCAERVPCQGLQMQLAAREPRPALGGHPGFGSPHQPGPSSLATPLGDPGLPPGLLTLASALPDSPGEAKPVTSLLAAEKPPRASLLPKVKCKSPLGAHGAPRDGGTPSGSRAAACSLGSTPCHSRSLSSRQPQVLLLSHPCLSPPPSRWDPGRTGHIRCCPASCSPRDRSRTCLCHGRSLGSSRCLVHDGGPANGCVLL